MCPGEYYDRNCRQLCVLGDFEQTIQVSGFAYSASMAASLVEPL